MRSRSAGGGAGIGISNRVSARVLPWLSVRSERLAPPPSTLNRRKLYAPTPGQFVTTHFGRPQGQKIIRDASLGQHLRRDSESLRACRRSRRRWHDCPCRRNGRAQFHARRIEPFIRSTPAPVEPRSEAARALAKRSWASRRARGVASHGRRCIPSLPAARPSLTARIRR